MIVLRIVIITLVAAFIAFAVGNAVLEFTSGTCNVRNSIGMRLFAGFVMTIATGIIIAGVFGRFMLPARFGFGIMAIILIAIIVTGIVMHKKKDKSFFSAMKFEHGLDNRADIVLSIVMILLIVVQIIAVVKYSYSGIDSIRGIAVATKVSDTGVCQAGSPMMNLIGIMSLSVGIHPLTFVYGVLPVGMLSAYYIGYYELFMAMSSYNRRSSAIAVITVSILSIWGYQSKILIPITLLLAYFTGYAYLVHGFLPFLMLLIVRRRRKDRITDDIESIEEELNQDEDYQEEWDMKKHKIINARNLAIALGALAVMMLALVFVLNKKINTIHASAVNLQVDLNSRCGMYEFVGDSGEVEGFLIKGSDGSLTMVGGGDASNAENLYEFITEHGNVISNWYVYGMDEENMGAYTECAYNKGIEVGNVYLIDRVLLN